MKSSQNTHRIDYSLKFHSIIHLNIESISENVDLNIVEELISYKNTEIYIIFAR